MNRGTISMNHEWMLLEGIIIDFFIQLFLPPYKQFES